MAGPAENNVGLVLATMLNDTVCADSLAGPELMALAHPTTLWGPASSGTVSSPPLVNEGASLTAVTEIVKCIGSGVEVEGAVQVVGDSALGPGVVEDNGRRIQYPVGVGIVAEDVGGGEEGVFEGGVAPGAGVVEGSGGVVDVGNGDAEDLGG
jgi:hypothetical protein